MDAIERMARRVHRARQRNVRDLNTHIFVPREEYRAFQKEMRPQLHFTLAGEDKLNAHLLDCMEFMGAYIWPDDGDVA